LLLNNSLEPWLSKPISLLSAKGLRIEVFLKKQSFALVIGAFPQATGSWAHQSSTALVVPLNAARTLLEASVPLLTRAEFCP